MEYYSSEGLKRAAKSKLSYQYGTAIGGYLLQVAILFAFMMIVAIALAGTILQPMMNLIATMDPTGDIMAVQKQLIEMSMTPRYQLTSQAVSALVGALAATLTTGYSYLCLKISRSETAKISDLFFVYKNNPDRVILLYLLSFLIQTLISLPSDVVNYIYEKNPQNVVLYFAGTVLSIASFVLTYIFSLMVSQVFFLYMDDVNRSVPEIFRESIALMKGHKGRLFYLQVSFIGWILLALLTCGVLLFWVGPYMTITFAEFYRNLKREPLYVVTERYPDA
ncbi:MAG: DUF975 family protein [Lachnospiraceae bacterium]|nr:DUF975 family protein [Lachnospiraceae bacterium]